MLTLDVAVSTYKPEGIKKVERMLPAPQDGVKYIVSWQEHENAPVPTLIASREDVVISRLDVKGLSNNRNNAIAQCRGDIILIADDDLQYEPDFANNIRKTFENNPEIDVALFKIHFHSPKKYPLSNLRLRLPFPKKYFVSSVEISFLRNRLNGLKFWPQMGLGNNSLECGEDELFLISAIKRGLNCWYINKTIATHSESTTGERISPGILRAQGFIISLLYPFSFIARLPLKALRMSKSKRREFFKVLRQLLKGALYYKTGKLKIPKEYGW